MERLMASSTQKKTNGCGKYVIMLWRHYANAIICILFKILKTKYEIQTLEYKRYNASNIMQVLWWYAKMQVMLRQNAMMQMHCWCHAMQMPWCTCYDEDNHANVVMQMLLCKFYHADAIHDTMKCYPWCYEPQNAGFWCTASTKKTIVMHYRNTSTWLLLPKYS